MPEFHRSPLRFLAPLAVVVLTTFLAEAEAQVERRNAITDAIDKCRPAIVCLKTLRVIPARFENVESGRVKGLGTGVLIDPRGFLVTNYHVVEDVDEIEARTADGRRYSATLIETDRKNDLAVLKIKTDRHLPCLSLVGVGSGIPGETVIAIGNPYGLEESVTIGIVSAVDRELKLPNGELFHGLLQTDASINPGNSGGPLITINGDLLGINVAIRSNAQGIAFAIPTERVRQIIAHMMERTSTVNTIGARIEENMIQKVGGVPNPPEGVLRVQKVDSEGSAARAGLQEGDEIVSVASELVNMRFDLDRVFWDRREGETIPVRIRRDNEELEFELTIGPSDSDEAYVWNHFGIKARPVVDPVRRVQPNWEGGVLVWEVREGSPAASVGIRPGDILAGLHGRMVLQLHHIRAIMRMSDFATSQPVRYDLIRDGRITKGQMNLSTGN